MKKSFSNGLCQLLFPVLIATAGLLTTACNKDNEIVSPPAKDYSAIDDAIIQKYFADSAITTAKKSVSGLYYVPVVTNPTAVQAVAYNTVDVKYTGRFMDGKVFDTSGSRSFSFVLGQHQVIAGWDEGIALMHKGDKAVLVIPSALAYGAGGAGQTIPPNTVIRFNVELVNVR